MPQVFISTGPSQGFPTNLDRIPVVGDNVVYQGKVYPILSVYLTNGGGADANAGHPQQSESGTSPAGHRSKPAAG